MARSTLSTAWSLEGTAVTAAFVQNLGPSVILAAFAAAEPAAAAEAGFVLQAGDYLPVSGITATNLYLRSFSGTPVAEVVTV